MTKIKMILMQNLNTIQCHKITFSAYQSVLLHTHTTPPHTHTLKYTHKPVQPCQEVLGRPDQVHHRGEEVIGEPARGPTIVVTPPAATQDEVL